ncbi:MAG: polyisoprenoid-binding protein YceI [Rubritalea sp.]|jgi:polyisoprenoid-binding protein YceI
MKTTIALFLVCASLLLNNKINTTDSEIAFTFESEGVTGTIGDIQSQSEIDVTQLEESIIKGSVSVSSLETGNFLRDGHLMWEKYFNRSDYARIYFESTRIKENKDRSYNLEGNLTIKGISKPVTFLVVKKDNTMNITGSIYTSDWNINIEKEKKKNKATITMSLKIDES